MQGNSDKAHKVMGTRYMTVAGVGFYTCSWLRHVSWSKCQFLSSSFNSLPLVPELIDATCVTGVEGACGGCDGVGLGYIE